MSCAYCVLVGCSDPRLNQKADVRNRGALKIAGVEDVIPLHRPGPTHLFPSTLPTGAMGRKIHRRAQVFLEEFGDHFKLHQPEVVVLAGHETCGKHPDCTPEVTAKAARVLQELLHAEGFVSTRVIAAFERQVWVGEWQIEALPESMQPKHLGQQLAAD